MSLLSYDYYGSFSAASNSSNANTAAAAAYSSQLNGPRTNNTNNNNNDSIGSPSSITSLSKQSGSSPVGRQSTSSVNNNNASNNSSSSNSSNSLVSLSSPQTNSSQNNAATSNRTTTSGNNNLLQQLDYSQAFTSATSNSSTANNTNLVNYHAAGQLSHQLNSNHSPNLTAGQQTSLHTHHNNNSHHHSTHSNATSNSIFTNSTNSHSHHHHSNNSSNLVLYNNDLPDTKEGLDELCPVCGDKVSGYHYGLLTCESCKGFFKRTVQNKKNYNCVAERQCHIDKSQRKRCPYCRFQKCLAVGMKLEAVRADRMRGGRNKFGPMYKRDRARRMQLLRQRQQIVLNSSLNSNASSANNSISISTTNNSASAAIAAAVCSGNLSSLAHGQGSVNGEPFSLLNSGILYSADGIKQELIQIPHLSSSTSSPDSSPLSGLTSAGTGTNSSNLNNLSTANSNQTLGSVAATHPELAKWVNGSMNGVAGSAPSPLVAGFNSASSSGVRSLTVGLANSSLSGNSSNGHKQGGNNSTFGFIGNRNSSALGPSFLASAGGSMMLNVAAAAVVASSSGGMSYVINELQSTAPNDKEWQSNLFSLLNEHTYNQCEVDLFDLMCKVIEKNLFAQVDWARNSIFFKDLKIEDQMKLLQHSWSHLLVLDHIHQRIHHGLQDESTLPNGQKLNLISLALLGETSTAADMMSVQNTLTELKFDSVDYICVKFLLLLNPEVRELLGHRIVQEAQDQTQHALHQYCVNYYPQVTDKFNKLMNELPKLRQLTARGEEFLHFKHMNGNAPSQTLLMEMLYARRK